MANETFSNKPIATLATGVVTTPAALTQETWSVSVSASGQPWPTLGNKNQFRCLIDSELILVTAGTTTSGTQSWTVLRGIENSTIATHNASAALALQITAAQVNKMTPRNYLYLPGGWDDTWQAAKAASASAPARILFLGDSIPTGYGSSDWKNAYPMLIRSSLGSTLGNWGDYWPAFGYSPITNAQLPGTPPWSSANASATITQANQFGWHRAAYDTNATEPTGYYFQTFTSPFACTSMDLFWVNWATSAGTWKHSVDAGTDVTVNTTIAAASTNATVNRISSGALANATHTWAFGKQSASGLALVQGVAAYYGLTGGLACAFMNNGASNAGDWNSGQQAQFPTKRHRLLAGVNPQTDATGNTTLGFGFPTQPHLAIIGLGVNDIFNNWSLTNVFDSLAAFCMAFRQGQPNCSILFHIICNPDQNSSDGAGLNGPTPNNIGSRWHQYTQYIYLLAQTFNAAVLNTHAKWGETPVGQGFLTVPNTVHATDAGHQDIANDLLTVL